MRLKTTPIVTFIIFLFLQEFFNNYATLVFKVLKRLCLQKIVTKQPIFLSPNCMFPNVSIRSNTNQLLIANCNVQLNVFEFLPTGRVENFILITIKICFLTSCRWFSNILTPFHLNFSCQNNSPIYWKQSLWHNLKPTSIKHWYSWESKRLSLAP